MNECIEFHDSTLREVREEGAACFIVLSPAYAHRSSDRPAIDAGSVLLQGFQITLGRAVLRKRPSLLPVDLDGGELRVGELVLSNTAPTALKHEGEVYLQLFAMRDDEVLEVEGSSILIRPCGEARYIENFPGV